MQIDIRYRSYLAKLTETERETIEASNIKDVLRHIKKNFGSDAEKLAKTMLIVVNGQTILQLSHFKTVLKEGDEVSFLPVCAGG